MDEQTTSGRQPCFSIQLVSPARGERLGTLYRDRFGYVSIQLVSPARGEPACQSISRRLDLGFHSISFPCERGTSKWLKASAKNG